MTIDNHLKHPLTPCVAVVDCCGQDRRVKVLLFFDRELDKVSNEFFQESAAKETSAQANTYSPGRLRAMIDTVIGNLQLRITNVHIRYEDAATMREYAIGLGLLLDEISAHTVDESGNETFVHNKALQEIRKVKA